MALSEGLRVNDTNDTIGDNLAPKVPGATTTTTTVNSGAGVSPDPFFNNSAASTLGGASQTAGFGQHRVPDISSLMSRVVTQNTLSAEGIAYIETIKNNLKSIQELNNIGTPTVFSLSNMPGVEVVTLQNMAVILIMYEAAKKNGDIAVVLNCYQASDELKKQTGNDYNVLSVISVHTADYSRVNNMVGYIANTFIGNTNAWIQGVTIQTFTPALNRGQFVIEFSRNGMSADHESPHAVPVRRDLTVHLKLRTDGGAYAAKLNGATGNTAGRFEHTDTDFLSVDTYVTFVRNTSQVAGSKAFIPMIHISDVRSPLPTKYTAVLAVALVSHALVNNSAAPWKQQFFEFANEDINIGELIADNGKVMQATTSDDVKAIFEQYIDDPYIVLDIVHGRASVPGIGELVCGTSEEALAQIADMNRFFGVTDFNAFSVLSTLIYREDIGYSAWNNNALSDTRCWDYLHVVHGRQPTSRMDDLLNLLTNSTNTIMVLKETRDIDTASLYHNEWLVFDANVLITITKLVVMALKLQPMGVEERIMSTDFLTSQARMYHSNNRNMSNTTYNINTMNAYYRR